MSSCWSAAVKADGFVYKGRMKSRVFGRRPPVAPRQFDVVGSESGPQEEQKSLPTYYWFSWIFLYCFFKCFFWLLLPHFTLSTVAFHLFLSRLLWIALAPPGGGTPHILLKDHYVLSVRIRWFTFTVVFQPPVMLPSTCVFFCVSLEKWQCVSHVVIGICCLAMS